MCLLTLTVSAIVNAPPPRSGPTPEQILLEQKRKHELELQKQRDEMLLKQKEQQETQRLQDMKAQIFEILRQSAVLTDNLKSGQELNIDLATKLYTAQQQIEAAKKSMS